MGTTPTDTASQRASRRGQALAIAVGILCLLSLATSGPAAADTLTVTTDADSGGGSLRATVAAAVSGDTIVFAPSLQGETIELTSGAIAIGKSLMIDGPGPAQLTVDAGHDSRIFEVTAGNLSISGLTLADGAAATSGGAIDYTGAGSLTVSDCAFTGNRAGGDGGSGDFSGRGRGGAIDYRGAGPLTISDSTFTANTTGGMGGASIESGLGRGGAINVSEPAASASISNSRFTANTAGGDGGGGSMSGRGEGGAIRVIEAVPLTVTSSTFTDNVAGGAAGTGPGSGAANGGAIYSFGALTVSTSTFDGNAAAGRGGAGDSGAFGFGGAIHNFSNQGSSTVSASTFTDNTAGGDGGNGNGGAIRVSSVLPRALLVSNSTLVGNAAGGGGGAGWGGAIEVDGSVAATLASVTIDANMVGPGGGAAGIHRATDVGTATSVTARATIVSGNMGAPNCNTPVISSSYSLEGPSASDASCGFDLPSANPQLGSLEDNGGPTETQALPLSSPAVEAVPLNACPTVTDQRGQPRAEFGEAFCDVGAFELVDAFARPVITSGAAATFQVGKAGSFTVQTGGVPAPTISHTGALPAGVTLIDNGNGTATLAGTPAPGTAGTHPITLRAANGIGIDATQSFTLTVQAPPTVVLAVPVHGATYTQGEAVATSFSCADGVAGPGIASCTDHHGRPSGAALDTATPGQHTFTVTATSKDGLTGHASVGYRVVPKPEPPRSPAPSPAPKLSLDVTTKSLRRLLRTGKLVVVASVDEPATVKLAGRARLRVQARGAARTRLVTVFKRKTARFATAGDKTLRLTLSRKGRRALRGLDRVRLAIAGKAAASDGDTATERVALTLRR